MSYSTSTEEEIRGNVLQEEVGVVDENQTRLDDVTNNDERKGQHLFSGDNDENSSFINNKDVDKTEHIELQQVVVDQGVDTSDFKSSAQEEDETLEEVI